MELKPGYKQSEVGVIPKDWNLDCIENLARITTGGKNTQDRVDDGLYPFFVRSQTVERINSYSYDGEAALTAGDGVGTGKVFHYINGKFDVHQRVYRISDFDERINGYFFYLYFSNHFYNRIMQMTAKSSVDSVRREMIAGMPIAFPSTKAEQEHIAEALRDAAVFIESLEQLIAKKLDIRQAVMQELLTGRKRLPGFDLSWKVCTLADIGTFSKGKGIKRDDIVDDGVPCIRYGEIYTHYDDYAMQFYSHISPEIAKGSQRIRMGDLLFTGSGETAEEIGKCVAYLGEGEAYAGGDIVVFSPIENDSLFLSYLMNHTTSVVNQKARFGQGDAVVHINKRSLALLRFQLPESQDEQRAIASNLVNMDAEIAMLEAERDKITSLKQGMIQNLLTGRIRLV